MERGGFYGRANLERKDQLLKSDVGMTQFDKVKSTVALVSLRIVAGGRLHDDLVSVMSV